MVDNTVVESENDVSSVKNQITTKCIDIIQCFTSYFSSSLVPNRKIGLAAALKWTFPLRFTYNFHSSRHNLYC